MSRAAGNPFVHHLSLKRSLVRSSQIISEDGSKWNPGISHIKVREEITLKKKVNKLKRWALPPHKAFNKHVISSTLFVVLKERKKSLNDHHMVITPCLLNLYSGVEKCLPSSQSEIAVGFFCFVYLFILVFVFFCFTKEFPPLMSLIPVHAAKISPEEYNFSFFYCFHPLSLLVSSLCCCKHFCNVEVGCWYFVQGAFLSTSAECVVW